MQYFTACYKAASGIQAEAAPGTAPAEKISPASPVPPSPRLTSRHLHRAQEPPPAASPRPAPGSAPPACRDQNIRSTKQNKHPRARRASSQLLFSLVVTTSALHSRTFSRVGCYRLPTSTPEDRDCLKDLGAAAVHPGPKCRQAVKKLATKTIIKSFNVLQ